PARGRGLDRRLRRGRRALPRPSRPERREAHVRGDDEPRRPARHGGRAARRSRRVHRRLRAGSRLRGGNPQHGSPVDRVRARESHAGGRSGGDRGPRRGDRDRALRLPESDQQRARLSRRLPRSARRTGVHDRRGDGAGRSTGDRRRDPARRAVGRLRRPERLQPRRGAVTCRPAASCVSSGPMRELPSGRLTLLFTDVEGSTRLLHELGPDYAEALAEHRRILRRTFATHGGVEVDTQGDAFFAVFPRAADALGAALEANERLADGPIRIRAGLHTGAPERTDEGYVGVDVHLGARVAATGHGGQVVLSEAAAFDLGPDAALAELGAHRLKDFELPVRLYQSGTDEFPPLKTISNTNLPYPASSFVGRQDEVAALVQRVGGGARLVTLTGPGGSGKTRLAIEAAHELVPEMRGGAAWVGLAPVDAPELVVETIARTLGARESVAAHIGDRELLLLLDNFEHVVGAAPSIAGLVEQCPNLHVLVTSRELLRVRGEVELPVDPLGAVDAVALFS